MRWTSPNLASRAPVGGLFHAARPEELPEAVGQSARVTHGHPLGIEGAVLVAAAVIAALRSSRPAEILESAEAFANRLRRAREWLARACDPSPGEVAERLGHGIAAGKSCPTALYVASRFLGPPFQEMQRFVAVCGGDTDTIGAMAGAVWGAANGAAALPPFPLARLAQRERISDTAHRLQAASTSPLSEDNPAKV